MRGWWLACLLFVPLVAGSDTVYKRGNQVTDSGELTLARLMSLKQIAKPMQGEFVTVYLDADAGSDSNDGLTPATAWETFDKVSDVFAEMGCGLEVVLNSGVIWDADADFGPGCAAGNTNCGMDAMAPTCADTDRIAMYMHSSDPDVRAVVNCTAMTNDGDDIFFSNPATDGGWVVYEGVQGIGCAADIFNAGNAGKVLVVNSHANTTLTTTSNILTSHTTSSLIALNWGGTTNPVSASAQAVAAIGDSKLVSITNGHIEVGPTSGNDACLDASDAATVTHIGGTCSVTTGALGTSYGVHSNPNTSGDVATVNVARLSVDVVNSSTSGQGMRAIASGAGENAIIIAYQMTLQGDTNDLITDATDPGAGATVLIECWDCVLGEYQAAQAIDVRDATSGVDTTIRGRLLVDDAEGTNTFLISGAAGSPFETVAALAAATPAGWDLTLTDTTNPVQWGTNPGLACDKDLECFQAANINYCIPMAAPIPKWVLGTDADITELCLNGDGRNSGAR